MSTQNYKVGYVGQGFLKLRFNTKNDDIAGATIAIKYKKPSGDTGVLTGPATIEDTKIVYQLADGEIDEIGLWEFAPFLEIGGLDAPCDSVKIMFKLRPLSDVV